jgi:aryl-alcohol dehydrogenase-like predicted oxidoreductase
MNLRKLGQSDLKITPIGMGAWAIGGGKWEFGWGAQDDKESVAAIHAGLDRGINWIDTAAVYGLGHSEEVVGTGRPRAGARVLMSSPSAAWSGMNPGPFPTICKRPPFAGKPKPA